MKVHLTHSWRNFKKYGWQITLFYLYVAKRKRYWICEMASMGWDYKYVFSITVMNIDLTVEWIKETIP